MKITLVPSAMSPGPVASGFFLSSYLIDDTVAIDAGGLGFLADISVQSKVEHIFLTHSHLDHIASLPILLDTVYEAADRCVTVHASQATLDCLRRDIFNDRVWPDFMGLSEKGLPFIKIEPIEAGRPIELAGLCLHPIAVDHVVPTLGFLVEAPGASVAIPSDTGPTEAFWKMASEAANLRAVFLEASFPDAMERTAMLSKHLTPRLWAAESRKLGPGVPFFAVHIKPRYYDRVVQDLKNLGVADSAVGRAGASYTF